MSEPRHTPGPWQIVEHNWSDTGIYAELIRVAGLSVEDEMDRERMEADARLMASAPDLLAVAESLVEAWASTKQNVFDVVEMARAAIAKAKGE